MSKPLLFEDTGLLAAFSHPNRIVHYAHWDSFTRRRPVSSKTLGFNGGDSMTTTNTQSLLDQLLDKFEGWMIHAEFGGVTELQNVTAKTSVHPTDE